MLAGLAGKARKEASGFSLPQQQIRGGGGGVQLQVPRRPRKRHSRETREELAAALGKPATNGGGTSCSLVPFAGEVASPHCVCVPVLRESYREDSFWGVTENTRDEELNASQVLAL